MTVSVCDARPCETSSETIKRVPVTQEGLATAIAANGRLSHPAQEYFMDILFESIREMVYKLAGNYKDTCHEDVEDLAQDCFCRVVKVLGKFDPKQAKFTTWAWHVCKSVLNRKYRKNQRHAQAHVTPYEGYEARSTECEDSVFKIDFADAVRDLKEAYPNREVLIHEIFGNPDSNDFVAGTAVGMKVAAQKAGIQYAQAYYFYSKIVKPFLRHRLEGYGQ